MSYNYKIYLEKQLGIMVIDTIRSSHRIEKQREIFRGFVASRGKVVGYEQTIKGNIELKTRKRSKSCY